MSAKKIRDSIMAETMQVLADRDNSIQAGFQHMGNNMQQGFGTLDMKIVTLFECLKDLGVTDDTINAKFAKVKEAMLAQQRGEPNVAQPSTNTTEGGASSGEEGELKSNERGSEHFR